MQEQRGISSNSSRDDPIPLLYTCVGLQQPQQCMENVSQQRSS